MTPRQIVAELDRYIIGQAAAKKAVAIALRNRYRRLRLPEAERDDVLPKNILMIGPTGVGKTEIARRMAQFARAPFIKVEATKFTEVGYVGRDVDSIIRDLVGVAVRLVERERTEEVREEAERRAIERLVELLDDEPSVTRPWRPFLTVEPSGDEDDDVDYEAEERLREDRRSVIRAKLLAGDFDGRLVEVETEEAQNPFVQVFSAQGVEEMGLDMAHPSGMFQNRRLVRKVTVAEAKPILTLEEAGKMVDKHGVHRDAFERAEQTGIVFLDEIDKVAGKSGGSGPDVSREGVQRDLLPIIEGATVQTKFGPVRTDHILFVAAGAFHISKPSDLIPELQGRLPIRVVLESLNEEDFRRILTEPKNALTKQYEKLLRADGVRITFEQAALDEVAFLATEVNAKTENIGARRLHTLMEKLLEDVLFEAPGGPDAVTIDVSFVRDKLRPLVDDLERSQKVL
ncbi:MAG: ATP-dependent protease ATPase subunit HslU [Fimbriimonadaceae bacterium]|nr:ATP-dependent protease ATPase subunit HslU [Fimbriimonadaceae bacterium]